MIEFQDTYFMQEEIVKCTLKMTSLSAHISYNNMSRNVANL